MAKRPGFTIVELLITIVIVGILVGIATLSFDSIVNKNKQKSLEGALMESASVIKYYSAANKQLPDNLQTAGANIDNLPDINLTYMKWGSPDFCLKGTNGDQTLYMDNVLTKPSATGCVSARPIQEVTRANCPSVRTLTKDVRDNYTYWVQKLADNQCWMLTNLAYQGGGINTYNDTISTSQLTNGEHDLLSAVNGRYYKVPNTVNSTINPEQPATTTNGKGQYGVLYNWCGAMGAQTGTEVCHTSAGTPANLNKTVCPAGWKIPTGGSDGQFAALNNAINSGSTTSDVALMNSPAMFQKGGVWDSSQGMDGFARAGIYGYYWSSTPNGDGGAYDFWFFTGTVHPGTHASTRSFGRAVRCIAN